MMQGGEGSKVHLRVLLVEDSEADALLLERKLVRGGYDLALERVETAAALEAALARATWDIVISDFMLPRWNGMDALRIVREANEELPFILVSGAVGEETAVEAIKAGASDYLLKDRLTRLPTAVAHALEEATLRRERQQAHLALAFVAIENARLYRQAQDAIAARDEFLLIAAHELKTPLTPLSLQVHGLLRESRVAAAPSECISRDLEATCRHVERLTRLVDQLLDVSRLGAKGLALVREPMDLAAVVREAADAARGQALDANCPLELALPGVLPGRWDRVRIAQMLAQLLSNAFKFGAGAPVGVTLECDDGWARLRVRDHGHGVAAADRERIFERFERAVSVRHYGGFGLGLWVARQIAEAHGGAITLESLAEGTVFTVALPL
jgi:signal transduction histidine kinase